MKTDMNATPASLRAAEAPISAVAGRAGPSDDARAFGRTLASLRDRIDADRGTAASPMPPANGADSDAQGAGLALLRQAESRDLQARLEWRRSDPSDARAADVRRDHAAADGRPRATQHSPERDRAAHPEGRREAARSPQSQRAQARGTADTASRPASGAHASASGSTAPDAGAQSAHRAGDAETSPPGKAGVPGAKDPAAANAAESPAAPASTQATVLPATATTSSLMQGGVAESMANAAAGTPQADGTGGSGARSSRTASSTSSSTASNAAGKIAAGTDPSKAADGIAGTSSASTQALAADREPPTGLERGSQDIGSAFARELSGRRESADRSAMAPTALAADPAAALRSVSASRDPQPVAPPQFEVAAPVGSDGFAPELTERVSLMLGATIDKADIMVSPPDMGPVRIELSLSGNDARMVFTAAQPETRQAIEQSAPLLRSMLSAQGLELSGFDVGAGSQFQQSARGDTHRSSAQTGQGGLRGLSGIGGADQPTAGAQVSQAARRGLLDLFA